MIRILPVALLLAACSAQPERTRIDSASLEVDAQGGLREGIGIAAGSRLVMVLERGCRLPCTATQTLRAAAGGQDAVGFMLYQGAGDEVATARALGTFRVPTDGKTPGTHEVEVTFVAERGGAFVSAAGKPDGRPLAVVRLEP